MMHMLCCKHPLLGKLPAEPRGCPSAETLVSPAFAEIHLRSHSRALENATVVNDSSNELRALQRISL